MKKLLPLALVLVLTGCSNNKEWSKTTLVSKCKTELEKDKTGMFTPENIGKICDCNIDKLMNKYKSQAEADKDIAGVEEIGTACSIQVLSGQ